MKKEQKSNDLLKEELHRMNRIIKRGEEESFLMAAENKEAADMIYTSGMHPLPRPFRDPKYEEMLKEKKNYDEAIAYLKSSAKAGNVEALVNLGMRYYYGEDVPVDINRASYYYEKAAEAGDAMAMYALALYYLNGIGIICKDVDQAIHWFEQSANHGYEEAWAALGDIYYNGKYVKRDYEKAFSYYMKGVDHYCLQCMLGAAKQYEKGQGVDRDKDKAYNLYKIVYGSLTHKAINNDINAQYLLGVVYFHGIPAIFLKKSLQHSFEWLEKAAKQGHTAAQNNLSLFYRFGLERPKDTQKALFWIEKAAEKKHPVALCNLGSMYLWGIGVEKDEQRAAELFSEAAYLGNSLAQTYLGNMYMHGKGVEKDYIQALSWLEKAHESGREGATDDLATCYKNGLGVEKDEKKAFKLYQKAAKKGNLHARISVAQGLMDGCGTTADPIEASQILKTIIEEESRYRDTGQTFLIDMDNVTVEKLFNEEMLSLYAHAYFLLGTLYMDGRGEEQNFVEARRLLIIADRYGFHDEEQPELSAKNKLDELSNTHPEELEDVMQVTVEIQAANKSRMTEGWPYEIVYKNKDEVIPLTFGGQRNRFVYLVALLRAKMRGTMTGRDFQTYQNVLEDLASLVHVTGHIVYDKWIEGFYTDGRAYDAHAYSQAITICNSRLRKLIDNESLRIKTSGGRDSVAILPLEPEQIIVADDFIPFMERLAGKSENKSETGDVDTYPE